jgi:hypothetical protein
MVTDPDVITALEALTGYDLVYFRSLTVTTISEVENQPLLTRDEASNLSNGQALVWDSTAQKAIGKLIDTVASANSTNLITSGAVVAALSNYLSNKTSDITAAEVDNLSGTDIGIYKIRNYNIGWVGSDGFIIHIPWSNQFAFQIALDDQSNWVAVRSKNQNVWSDWARVYSGRRLNDISGFSYSMAGGYSVTNIQIDNVNFWASGINVFHLSIINISGGTIGGTASNVIGSCNLRPIQNAIAIGMDYVSGRPVRVEIDTDGRIMILESVGVTQGNNQIKAVFTAIL